MDYFQIECLGSNNQELRSHARLRALVAKMVVLVAGTIRAGCEKKTSKGGKGVRSIRQTHGHQSVSCGYAGVHGPSLVSVSCVSVASDTAGGRLYHPETLASSPATQGGDPRPSSLAKPQLYNPHTLVGHKWLARQAGCHTNVLI